MSDSGSEPILKVVCPSCQQKLDVTGLPGFSTIQCPACDGDVIVPRRFGDLLLEEPIGSGGMASVYRALDLTLDREVAVKILNKSVLARPDRAKLFLKEARNAAAVNHPNVVPIYSCGEVDEQPYLVMQYMGGLSLDRHLADSPKGVPLDLALRACADAARGLEAAYRHGIVHHDVKPGNVLMDVDGNVRIGDFGLAQIVRDESAPSIEALTKHWVSPFYVSSEKVRTGEEDYRGDIYSLGATLYHVMTGTPPFSGEDPESIARARLEGPLPVPPATLRAEITTPASEFVMQLLEPDPSQRPSDYAPIIGKLDAFRKGLRHSAALRKKMEVLGGQALEIDPGCVAAGIRQRPSPPVSVPGSRPASRLEMGVNAALGVSLLVLLLLVVHAGRARAPWFVQHVEPVAQKLFGSVASGPDTIAPTIREEGLAGASAEDGASRAGSPSVAGSPAVSAVDAEPSAVTAAVPRAPGTEADAGSTDYLEARPRPHDLDFFGVKEELRAYLQAVPLGLREVERERIEHLSSCRGYLIQLMKYLPYGQGGARIRLRDGSELSGGIPFCSDRELMVRLNQPGAPLRKLRWDDLAFEQYAAFYDYYLRTRVTQGEHAAEKASSNEHLREAGDDSFRLALLCEWYGRLGPASKYADLACEYSPSMRATVDRFLPGLARPE